MQTTKEAKESECFYKYDNVIVFINTKNFVDTLKFISISLSQKLLSFCKETTDAHFFFYIILLNCLLSIL